MDNRKIKILTIEHHRLGIIKINTIIPDDLIDRIGRLCYKSEEIDFNDIIEIDYYLKRPHFFNANIRKGELGSFYVENFKVIKPVLVPYNLPHKTISNSILPPKSQEKFKMKMPCTVGDKEVGYKEFVKVIKNVKAGDDMIVYPRQILFVTVE